jgi:hypothetical protein
MDRVGLAVIVYMAFSKPTPLGPIGLGPVTCRGNHSHLAQGLG